MTAPVVIYTDLDGALLDRKSYSWHGAEEALEEIDRRRVPLVFCTSKTRAEVEDLRRKLGNSHPFITENGGGVFIPHGYFAQPLDGAQRAGHYHCFVLGRAYAEITEELDRLATDAGVNVAGFHQMSTREIASNTGLNLRQAERYLPDNIYTAIDNFRNAEWTTKLLGEDVKARYADLKQASADRCPHFLGTVVKAAEVQFHHEVYNQYLWNLF
jgi:mannosyl-3-phosphoglycerate phosphatase family protein